jgi:DNA polymerase-3 subunit delta
MDAFTFIEQSKPGEPRPIYVLAGEERFLKRLALERIQALAFGADGDDFARSAFEGDSTSWATVRDELETLPFLSPRRLVIVQDADDFVSENRASLEKYVGAPSSTGVLVLDVKSWKSNTRLAKMLDDRSTLKCEALSVTRLPQWLTRWAKTRHGKTLAGPAAELLVELIGAEMGILDQEVAKLATYVGDRPQIETADVDTLVGHSRVNTAWEMLDALAEGNRLQAFDTLHHLLDQGEQPIAILGAMSWQLRKLAQVARLTRQGMSPAQAMGRSGVPPFTQRRTESHLRHLGPRALKLYEWLLEADLALKSSGGLTPRAVLERLLARLGAGNQNQGAGARRQESAISV